LDASANSSAHSFVTNRFSAFPVCAIASDPNNVNGAVTYTYDPVGNRTQKVSTLPSGPSNYNANDQLATDTYDSNGNTTVSNGLGYVYDFENHLLQASGITYVYDGDGNRFLKTVAGVPTQYVVDEENPTGYTQVVSEMTITTAGYAYVNNVYGLERINQWRVPLGQAKQVSWYVYDGHGSVRALTDQTGAVTDTYDYDAFGNLIHSTGTTPNNYFFAGEQFDPDLGLYYNRGRYLSVSTGRFWTMDTFEGDQDSPLSLHRYLYVGDDPIDHTDRSGHGIDEIIASAMSITIAVAAVVAVARIVEYVTAVFGRNLSNDDAEVVNVAIAVLDPVPTLIDEAWVLHDAKYRRGKPPYLSAVCKIVGGCFAAAELGFLFIDDRFFDASLLHDSVEQAAVLLHEAFHLEGGNEHDAYAGVWVNKEKFGWTRESYSKYFLWGQVEAATRQYAPELF